MKGKIFPCLTNYYSEGCFALESEETEEQRGLKFW
jgi:hypothetical protein